MAAWMSTTTRERQMWCETISATGSYTWAKTKATCPRSVAAIDALRSKAKGADASRSSDDPSVVMPEVSHQLMLWVMPDGHPLLEVLGIPVTISFAGGRYAARKYLTRGKTATLYASSRCCVNVRLHVSQPVEAVRIAAARGAERRHRHGDLEGRDDRHIVGRRAPARPARAPSSVHADESISSDMLYRKSYSGLCSPRARRLDGVAVLGCARRRRREGRAGVRSKGREGGDEGRDGGGGARGRGERVTRSHGSTAWLLRQTCVVSTAGPS